MSPLDVPCGTDKNRSLLEHITLFARYNSSAVYQMGFCEVHLDKAVKCSCEEKSPGGKVSELRKFFEEAWAKKCEGTRPSLYRLTPTVHERVKKFEMLLRNKP
jgi:hypothetical protein